MTGEPDSMEVDPRELEIVTVAGKAVEEEHDVLKTVDDCYLGFHISLFEKCVNFSQTV